MITGRALRQKKAMAFSERNEEKEEGWNSTDTNPHQTISTEPEGQLDSKKSIFGLMEIVFAVFVFFVVTAMLYASYSIPSYKNFITPRQKVIIHHQQPVSTLLSSNLPLLIDNMTQSERSYKQSNKRTACKEHRQYPGSFIKIALKKTLFIISCPRHIFKVVLERIAYIFGLVKDGLTFFGLLK